MKREASAELRAQGVDDLSGSQSRPPLRRVVKGAHREARVGRDSSKAHLPAPPRRRGGPPRRGLDSDRLSMKLTALALRRLFAYGWPPACSADGKRGNPGRGLQFRPGTDPRRPRGQRDLAKSGAFLIATGRSDTHPVSTAADELPRASPRLVNGHSSLLVSSGPSCRLACGAEAATPCRGARQSTNPWGPQPGARSASPWLKRPGRSASNSSTGPSPPRSGPSEPVEATRD